MRILKNATPDAQAPQAKHRQAVLDAIAAAPAALEFDAIRAELALDKTRLPDGAIHQIAVDAGLKVEG